MTKVRVFLFLFSTLIVLALGGFFILYASGFRLNRQTGQITANGLLVVNSDPNGAQVLIDGKLTSATNATIALPPATYTVELHKDGYISWKKTIQIAKDAVTQLDASLFPAAPSLSAITFSGIVSPVLSPDSGKIVYGVMGEAEKQGLWVMETTTLPLGFNREPRRITDGDLTGFTWQWSPDSQQILLSSKTSSSLLSISSFTSISQRLPILVSKQKLLSDWEAKKITVQKSQLAKLPPALQTVFTEKTTNLSFSPDETRILYTATGSATLQENLLPQLPGSSTQTQARALVSGKTYVFDIKEDRNFEVSDSKHLVYWFPNSMNLLVPEENNITIMDYDGTNRQPVYIGSYVSPNAFPSPNTGRLFLLTNLGATGAPVNLYSLSLK
jgi:dipeptidyl aminopeptidase/acylaminoacyl peptidase